MAVAMIGPKFYAWDKNGKPLAGGKLYTYQARTNNPKDTYQSEDQIVANDNPVILNSEGYANVYLSGSYKIVLKDDTGAEIWSADPVSSAEPSEWVVCLTATYISSTSFKVNGNFTEQYEPGRRVRIDNNTSNYSYSTIVSSSFANDETTVTIFNPVITTGIQESCISIVGPESSRPEEKKVLRFKTLQNAIESLLISDGDTLEIKERTTGNGGGATWDVVLEQTVTTNSYNVVASTAIPSLALVLRDNGEINIEQWGAISDDTYTTDSSAAIQAAADYIKAALPTYSKKLVGNGNYLISSDVNLRQVRCDFSAGAIGVGTGVNLIIGNVANEGFGPKQQFGQVFRFGEPINTPNPASPIVVIKGSKGQTIDIDFCPHVQLYADTDSSVGGNTGPDSSIAYSTFNFNYVYRLHLTNNPTTDGTLIQWINENTFNLKRTLDLLVDGTYSHNHNVFNTGDWEGNSTINFQKGNSNVLTYGRFENNSGSVIFSADTWGNRVEKSWYSNWRNIYEDYSNTPAVVDSGRGNMVVRTSDGSLRNVELLAISRGTAQSFEVSNKPITTVKNFFVSVGDADGYRINGSFRNFYVSDLIPVQKGDALLVTVDSINRYRFKWCCYNSDGQPVTPVDDGNVGTDANTKTVAGNCITQVTDVPESLIAIFDDEIAYITLSVLSGASVSAPFDFDTFTIRGKTSFLNNRKWADNSLCVYQTAATSGTPTKGFASLGQIVERNTGTDAYKCTFSHKTTAVSGSGTTLVVDDATGVAINDVIGIKEVGETLWTTVAGVSGTTLTLTDPLVTTLGGSELVYVNRWVNRV